MRPALVVLHRWFGLFIATFLIIAGLTGAIISWDHELDEWLNPHLFESQSQGEPLPVMELVERVEAADSRVRASFFPLEAEPGHNLEVWVDAKQNPDTGRRYPIEYDHVFVDPVTGEIVGKRLWGQISLHPEHLMSFLYKLHFTLHLPEWKGTDRWGIWLMGIAALVWLFDTFIAMIITLPRKRRTASSKGWLQRWKPAWKVRRGAGAYKLNFDLHRAVGLWVFGLLLMLAFTSFSLNLYREVFYPIMSTVSETTPGPFETRTPSALHDPVEPSLAWQPLIGQARAEADQRGWNEPVGDVFYSDNFAVFGVRFFFPGEDHDSGGMKVKSLYYDNDGQLIGDEVPWTGTAADVFNQLQFPLHSGRIAGLPGRIIISFMGIAVAMLSFTGIVIWWKKRKARVASRRRREEIIATTAPNA
ncbi:PepSY domain-containing protein [Alcanivorax sp. S6407]|uniref:PepSY-associated TM helix domain-containing protein n=1 Tax=Alcanivorax sp. S6407 TaxID=2926424 RepID=UPI001FF6E2C3|nr:PepSY-associated TM helix domain-containing protein [Alcanivorax sp. S6407]MCK0154491.1 PepSY domain-containing protein [Alcanivorax sp. S6407]